MNGPLALECTHFHFLSIGVLCLNQLYCIGRLIEVISEERIFRTFTLEVQSYSRGQAVIPWVRGYSQDLLLKYYIINSKVFDKPISMLLYCFTGSMEHIVIDELSI